MDIEHIPDGEPKPDKLYRIVGEAISKYEEVEFYLSSLFSAAMGGSAHAGQLVWQSVGSLDTRLKMLEAAAEAARIEGREFGERPDLSAALRAAKTASNIRSEFAHGVVWNAGKGGKGGYLLLRSFAKTIQTQFDPPNMSDLKQLKAKMKTMQKYAGKVKAFAIPVLQHYSDQQLAATRTEPLGQ